MHRLRQGEKLTRQTLPIIRSVQFRKSKSDILEKCGGLDFWLPKQTEETHISRALAACQSNTGLLKLPVHAGTQFIQF